MAVSARVGAVVLDVGETLVAEGRMWGAWAHVCGVDTFTFAAALGAAIAAGSHRQVFDVLGVDPEPRRAAFLSLFGGYRPDDLYPDALEGVRLLRGAGYRVGIAGNQRAWSTPALRVAGLEADAYGTSEDWGVAKPDPAFFRRCCAEIGSLPAETAYVGDDPVRDVAAARAAGLRAVWVRRGPWALLGDRDAAQAAEAVVTSLAELPCAVAGLGLVAE